MIDFKFLSENEDDDFFGEPVEWVGASWSWVRTENITEYDYDILVDNHYGIHSFLNNFPDGFVVSVLSITGPNGFVHTIDSEGNGWGFDIRNDLIRVEWIRFIDRR